MRRFILTIWILCQFATLNFGQVLEVNEDLDCSCWMNSEGEIVAKYSVDPNSQKKIYYYAQFDNLVFQRNTYFSNSIFTEIASFKNCEFDISTTFSGATFEKEVYFTGTKFHDGVNFYNSTFNSVSNFLGTNFVDTTIFSNAKFQAIAYFHAANFQSASYFNNADFAGYANFGNAKFQGISDFSSASFNKKADFGTATFENSVKFNEVAFLGHVNLRNSNLPDTIFLSNMEMIANPIDFMSISDDSINTHCIYFSNSFLSNVNIKFDNPKKKFSLGFPKNFSVDDKSGVYESILSKLNKDGYNRSFQIIDIAYKKHLYNSRESDYWMLVGWVDEIWWNFGYDKQWIIRNSLVLFIIFWTLNVAMFFSLNKEVYPIENVLKLYSDPKPKKSLPILGSFYYTAMVFFGVAINYEKVKYTNTLLSTYFFIQYIVGLICLAYFLNYFIHI